MRTVKPHWWASDLSTGIPECAEASKDIGEKNHKIDCAICPNLLIKLNFFGWKYIGNSEEKLYSHVHVHHMLT